MGIKSLEGAIPVSLQTESAIGISSATTAESFTKAEIDAEMIQKTISAMM